jgi:hypothetical protein
LVTAALTPLLLAVPDLRQLQAHVQVVVVTNVQLIGTTAGQTGAGEQDSKGSRTAGQQDSRGTGQQGSRVVSNYREQHQVLNVVQPKHQQRQSCTGRDLEQ